MRKYGMLAVRLAGLLAALILCYTLLLLAAYSFPDEWVKPNVDAAVGVLQEEGNMPGGYATYFWHNGYGIADLVTDRTIFGGLLRNGRGVVDAAMRTDYARYWHGYAVILRPAMTVLSIINLRYLNMLLILGLFLLCYWHCRRRLGAWAAFLFSAGLMMSFLLIAPFCQQYMTVSVLTLLASYLLLRFWERLRSRLPECFLMLGSLVCFFDFLTFPVLALGYPLLLVLLLKCKEGCRTGDMWGTTIGLSAIWMAGYALTWLGKALVGGMLTNENVLASILEQVVLRTTGTRDTAAAQNVQITVADAIGKNMETFFMGSNAAFFAVLFLLTIGRALRSRQPVRAWIRALPVAAVALYPFIWYGVMRNHVRVHFWMTYKMLSVTVFAACAYGLCVARGGLENTENNKLI